ncbi:hypothetical protein [Noviherbaspirillum humi]|uniref:hypothetical protein n=1 Tax=Noviherbaspirillum humi TaxID=1688639 RepID=UPI0011605E99|nr:hypothetical protein [Noviherbaspirillum humi]
MNSQLDGNQMPHGKEFGLMTPLIHFVPGLFDLLAQAAPVVRRHPVVILAALAALIAASLGILAALVAITAALPALVLRHLLGALLLDRLLPIRTRVIVGLLRKKAAQDLPASLTEMSRLGERANRACGQQNCQSELLERHEINRCSVNRLCLSHIYGHQRPRQAGIEMSQCRPLRTGT